MKKWIVLAIVSIIMLSFLSGLAIGWHYGSQTVLWEVSDEQ